MEHFWEIFWIFIGGIASGLGTFVLASVTSKWKASKEDQQFHINESILIEIVRCAIHTTNQRYVDDLKKTKNFNDEAKKVAYKMTFNLVKEQLTPSLIKHINTYYGNLDERIKTVIETTIAENKTNNLFSNNLED